MSANRHGRLFLTRRKAVRGFLHALTFDEHVGVLGPCRIEIDRVRGLGRYVEVEAISRSGSLATTSGVTAPRFSNSASRTVGQRPNTASPTGYKSGSPR